MRDIRSVIDRSLTSSIMDFLTRRFFPCDSWYGLCSQCAVWFLVVIFCFESFQGCRKDPPVEDAITTLLEPCPDLFRTHYQVPFIVSLDGWAIPTVAVDSLDVDDDGEFDLRLVVHQTGHVTPTAPHDFVLGLVGINGTLIVAEGSKCTNDSYLNQCGPDLDTLSLLSPTASTRASVLLRLHNLTQSDFCGCIRLEPGYMGFVKSIGGSSYCGFVKLRVAESTSTSSDGFGIEVFGHAISTCPDRPVVVSL